MAGLIQIAGNLRAKKALKSSLADATGVSPTEINDENLGGANQILEGAKAAQAQGADPAKLAPEALKAAGGGEATGNSSLQHKIALALTGLLPVLVGYAGGGAEGGAAGGAIGAKAVGEVGQAEERDRLRQAQLAKEGKAEAFEKEKFGFTKSTTEKELALKSR